MRNDWPVEHVCKQCLRYSPDGLDEHDLCPECTKGATAMPDGLKMKYFVLNPTKKNAYGYASRTALLAYAASIEDENYVLARDLREWVKTLEGGDDAKPE